MISDLNEINIGDFNSLIFQCICGCPEYRLYIDGSIKCAECETNIISQTNTNATWGFVGKDCPECDVCGECDGNRKELS